MLIESLPLTINGKLEWADLLERPQTRPIDSLQGEAPGVIVEDPLVRLWAFTLGLDSVGLDTNPFDLVATSYHLVAVHVAIGQEGIDVPIIALFEHPRIRDLAAFLAGMKPNTVAIGGTSALRQRGALSSLKMSQGKR